jgi:hypothetical protein
VLSAVVRLHNIISMTYSLPLTVSLSERRTRLSGPKTDLELPHYPRLKELLHCAIPRRLCAVRQISFSAVSAPARGLEPPQCRRRCRDLLVPCRPPFFKSDMGFFRCAPLLEWECPSSQKVVLVIKSFAQNLFHNFKYILRGPLRKDVCIELGAIMPNGWLEESMLLAVENKNFMSWCAGKPKGSTMVRANDKNASIGSMHLEVTLYRIYSFAMA